MAAENMKTHENRIELDEFDRGLLAADPAADEAAQILEDAGRAPYYASDDMSIGSVWDLDPENGVFDAPAEYPDIVPRAVSIDGGPEFGAWVRCDDDGREQANYAGHPAARFDLRTALEVAAWANALNENEAIRYDPAARAFLEYDGGTLVAASPADEWGTYEISPGAIWSEAVAQGAPDFPADALRPDLVARRAEMARGADLLSEAGDARLRALCEDPSPDVRLEVARRGFALDYLAGDHDPRVKAEASARFDEQGRFAFWRPSLEALPATLSEYGAPLPDATDKLACRVDPENPRIVQYAYSTELANGSAFCHGELDLSRDAELLDEARASLASGRPGLAGGGRAASMADVALACAMAIARRAAGEPGAPIAQAWTGEFAHGAAADAMWRLQENPRKFAAEWRAAAGGPAAHEGAAFRGPVSGRGPEPAREKAPTPNADAKSAKTEAPSPRAATPEKTHGRQ